MIWIGLKAGFSLKYQCCLIAIVDERQRSPKLCELVFCCFDFLNLLYKKNPSVTDNTLQCHEINLLNLNNGIDIWHEINIRPRKCGKNDKLRINVGPRKFISIF